MSSLPSPSFGRDHHSNRQGGAGDRRIDVADLFNRLPPHALEAEAALLGSIILDWRVAGDVIQQLRGPEDFYKPAHAALYETLLDLYDTHQSIDLVQLNQKLIDKGILDQVGGLEYLVQLAEGVPSAASANHYARLVREKAMVRRLIEIAGDVLHACYHADEPAQDLLDQAERRIFEVAEGKGEHEAQSLSQLVDETLEVIQNAQDGRIMTGVETGFFELDEMTNGLQPGEMIIVAARPSMGKTALALNIAEHMALEMKKPVAVFSLEMSRQQLAQRLLCSKSGVDSHKVRRNLLSQSDLAELQFASVALSEAPMYIDDTPGLSLLALRAKARRLAARHGIQAVLIDYLQLMSAPGSESRQQEVSVLSRGIKALARELAVPVICLSQLNRAAESREGHRPRLSDLRESGSIEQDADVVMMLHREDYYHRGEEDYVDTNVAELILAKQRNGPTGTVKLTFHGGTTRFHNLARGEY